MLEADESQVDQPCQCPHCGAEFFVPPPIAAPIISIGAGMLVSAAALLIHIQLSFAIAMIAGAAALITLTQVVNRLARRAGMPTRTTRIQ